MLKRAIPWRLGSVHRSKRGALPRAPLFFCLFGFFQSAVLASQEFLGQRGELVVRQLALLVQLHLRLGGLAAAALAFLCYVSLVVRHPFPPDKLRPMIVADQEKDARLGADFRGDFK